MYELLHICCHYAGYVWVIKPFQLILVSQANRKIVWSLRHEAL